MTAFTANDLLNGVLREQNVDDYVTHLLSGALDSSFPLPTEIEFSSLRETKCKWSLFGKVAWVKRWFGDNPRLFPSGVKVSFPLWSKYGCHMDDAGNVRFPLPALLKRFDPLVKYVFHESAHLYIAASAEYAELLALDKAFRASCGKDAQANCLSPAEYFASLLSVRLLKEAAETLGETRLAKRIRMQVGVEERKLTRAKDAFTASLS